MLKMSNVIGILHGFSPSDFEKTPEIGAPQTASRVGNLQVGSRDPKHSPVETGEKKWKILPTWMSCWKLGSMVRISGL